jgi:lipid-binding SYLF domain-containing protein
MTGTPYRTALHFRPWMIAWVSAALMAACATEHPPRMSQLQSNIHAANHTLGQIKNSPQEKSYSALLPKAKGMLVISRGVNRAVAVARRKDKDDWSGPAFYKITRVSAGPTGFTTQRQDLELVALIMSEKALNWLMTPHLSNLSGLRIEHANAISLGKSAGDVDVILFDSTNNAGNATSSLSTVTTIDNDANQAYYEKAVAPKEILTGRAELPPSRQGAVLISP